MEKIVKLRQEALDEVSNTQQLTELQELRIKYLGKKGAVTGLLRGLGEVDPAERPRYGQEINAVREAIEAVLDEKTAQAKRALLDQQLASERIDITLPGRQSGRGRAHPLTITLEKIQDTFRNMGFSIAEGPEVESDYFNFEALNLPKDHPARDMQDSFYITEDILLRTHTSPVQVRTMQATPANQPIRIIAPGKVYRRDYDATHSPIFHQVEGLVIDEGIRFSDLKGTLEAFIHAVFGSKVGVRFRPSFFPFTEPSAEVDISCVMCGGSGCRVCSHTGWLEILGSGMVHPKVLAMSNHDPAKVTGFAFGMGVERIAMLLYGIDDLRLFYDNDIRFLKQF